MYCTLHQLTKNLNRICNSDFFRFLLNPKLFNTAESSMNPQQFRRFARGICDHSKSRKLCGRVLNGFACRMTSSEACSFISDIVSYDFFLDLPGSMKSFYREMPEIGEQVESFLSTTRTMDREGNIVDSDEDEAGNLRYFFTFYFFLFLLYYCIFFFMYLLFLFFSYRFLFNYLSFVFFFYSCDIAFQYYFSKNSVNQLHYIFKW